MKCPYVPLLVLLSLLPCLAPGCGGASPVPVMVLSPLTVTTLADDGAGSLRAIVASVPPDGAAVIDFAAGLAGTVSLVSGPIVLSGTTTIQGPGHSEVSIDGGGLQGLFEVPLDVVGTIAGLELRASGGPTAAVHIEGDATLVGLRIVDCHASGSNRGGGVRALGGSVTMIACRVELCSASLGGGVAFDHGTRVILRDCAINANSTIGNSGGGLITAGCQVEATNCTFADNVTTGGAAGGAIVAAPSTITGNFDLSLSHCTIAENTADGSGGGLFLTGGVLTIRNTIVARNLSNGIGSDIESGAGVTIVTLGHNLIGDPTGSVFPKTGVGDLLGAAAAPIDPQLAGLGFNGGPTQCFGLVVTSPAIDLVPPGDCLDAAGNPLPVDQTGKARPIGPGCDAGSFESP